ncbi:hypothetical protein KY339_03185 [Candidatus Woesearchaeota archaeon]|nr:hypothetical protein [Candidatus Woesearchaeota archaeon]
MKKKIFIALGMLIMILLAFFIGVYVGELRAEPDIGEPPYVQVSQGNFFVAFNKLNGSPELWEFPSTKLESDITRGLILREFIPQYWEKQQTIYDNYYNDCKDGFGDCKEILKERDKARRFYQQFGYVYLDLKRDNEKVVVIDLRPYVEPDYFVGGIEKLYNESSSDSEFVKEVWNIVSQLRIRSKLIAQTPRFAFETLLAEGGDCEDTAILFASMIKAAPVDWKVDFVFMDIENPTDLKNVNHVIVSIDTGKEKFLIDPTNEVMQPWEEVDGWYVEI